MSSDPESRSAACDSPNCCCGPSRRDFLKWIGVGAAAAAVSERHTMAGPFIRADFETLVPSDKKLQPEWVRSLYARGASTVYRGDELKFIGMPVGGICAGQVYLGGDGQLWHWDVFNAHRGTVHHNYAHPPLPSSPLEQRFSLQIKTSAGEVARTLDRKGFAKVTFCGEYPIGTVEYRDDQSPLAVTLEAFSPFIPLNTPDSAIPATVMRFTVKNVSGAAVEAQLWGTLENAVAQQSGKNFRGVRRNTVTRGSDATVLECIAEASRDPAPAEKPPTVFADFEGDSYGEWKAEGTAFGKGPAHGAPDPMQHLSGYVGRGLANSRLKSDVPRGKLISPAFTIERPFISFLIGGGNHPGQTCINLVVGEKVVRTSTGRNSDAMAWDTWNVQDLRGKQARIEIVDNHTGGYGHIDIDQIEFRDQPRGLPGTLEQQPDFGTMALALLDPRPADLAQAASEGAATASETRPWGEKLVGRLGRNLALQPGQEETVTFAVAWHFPNLRMGPLPEGRRYAKRFASAPAVAGYVAANFARLHRETRLWHDTWYDSTLPYWFLDRTFANTSILATSTCYWFGNGRFYGWEGVGCCAGTCGHVWHYAQAPGRLFPELERSVREMVDFGLALNPKTGAIRFRGEFNGIAAADSQAGCILRAYREHQMSVDDAFLKRNWPAVKLALEYLIARDGDGDGILEGPQHNTLDADWFGPVAWLSGLYLAALRAGEAMAREVGDEAFVRRAREIADRGGKKIVELLFDGEYFINKPDPKFPKAINSGTGCEIDQVFGQSWAFQVGLGRVLPEKETRAALKSLWKYNFAPDAGAYHAKMKAGRWYAMPGEAGLLMCTFPRTDWSFEQSCGKGNPVGFAMYFNECMNGFEYQVAGHMLWEGMVEEGLAITRAVHDRYHAARRNPWNEVECGDHYARSMASYGVFLAACGYEYHGPRGHLAFAPRLTPEDFRAPFTAAEGWGTFHQRRDGQRQRQSILVRWGRLRLNSLAFALVEGVKAAGATVTLDGKPVASQCTIADGRAIVRLSAETVVPAGSSVEVVLG